MKKRVVAYIILGITFFLPLIYSYCVAPNLRQYRSTNPRYTSFMQYRVLQALHRGEPYATNFTYVPLKDISPYVINGLIFSEDGNFYKHRGLDVNAVRESFFINLTKHKVFSGGSTITMQLSKNLFLYPKKTLFRKLTEAWIAIRMENNLPKYRILELYLNVIEWGRGIYGVEAASQHYFGKSAKDLTVEESAELVAMIPAPLRWKPEQPSKPYQQRINRILNFLISGNITSTENESINESSNEPIYEDLWIEEPTENSTENSTITENSSESQNL
jgi:monofunctional biosynthetic peptidoglycan transglycosylase